MFLKTSKFAFVIQTILAKRQLNYCKNFKTQWKYISEKSSAPQSRELLTLNQSNHNIQLNRTMATSSSTTAVTPPSHTNRLIHEKSPYLLQHAHNPVDWYPWGDEAIQKAKDENKLIFLSIGYSTCHWCHVMEKESFESVETAKIMNHFFVNIKVDREERPDIDQIYMNFLLMINGSGGWPMSVWLTPDLAPITAGTYFPPTDQWGIAGFKTILLSISKKWQDNGAELSTTGRRIIEAMRKSISTERDDSSAADAPTSTETKFDQAIKIYKRNADDLWGGFGTQPKFPEVSKLNLLLHSHLQKPESDTLGIVVNTLKKIAQGGIHDHIFGGFSRYSVDRKWHVPHFEKMLYDQGQLLMAYTNVHKATHDTFYSTIAEDIFRYLTKDLQHPSGGFYSGEDADSYPAFGDKDKIEGAFYAWTWQEIKDYFDENRNQFQTDKAFDVYCHYYGVEENGNVEPSTDPQGHFLEKNIFMIRTTLDATATTFGLNKDDVQKVLNTGNTILYEVRNKRPRPHLDTKIITAWNGLVLSGLSKLACISDISIREQSLKAAKRLMEFIRTNLYDEQKKTLMRTCYGIGTDSDEAIMLKEPIQGFLDDYAFLIKGLLDYYLATLDTTALHWAKALQLTQDKLFWDTKLFGYFYSMENAKNVIFRMKEEHDGAEPCGNSVAASNLLLLGAYFEDESYRKKALKLFDYFGKSSNPFGYVLPEMMSALLLYDRGLTTIVVCGSKNDKEICSKMFDIARNFYIPGLVLIHNEIDGSSDLWKKSTVKQYKLIDNKPTVYICNNQECGLPIVSLDDLKNQLEAKYLFKI